MRVDPRAFCEQLRPRLVGSLTLYCADRAVGEELAHEALIRAFARWDRVGQMASPEAWTYRTAFNLARSWFRRRALERRAHRLAGTGVAVAPLPDAATAIAVRSAVAALPPRQRAVIVARFYGGLTVEETATALGCAPGTVKAHTHRALARLRDQGLADGEDDQEEVGTCGASR